MVLEQGFNLSTKMKHEPLKLQKWHNKTEVLSFYFLKGMNVQLKHNCMLVHPSKHVTNGFKLYGDYKGKMFGKKI